MHESIAEIESLQKLLDVSYEKAGKHYRSIHTAKRRMSAVEVCTQLEGVAIFDLATVSKSAKPLVAPVDGLFFKGTLWFSSGKSSIRFKHIRNNPHVSAAYTQGEEISIIVHGLAHEVDTSRPGHEALHEYYLETYGPSYDSWGLWGKSPFARIKASAMYGSRPGVDR